jgi:hypothetical protein
MSKGRNRIGLAQRFDFPAKAWFDYALSEGSRRKLRFVRDERSVQQKRSAEDAQREIAIVTVIALEETSFLLPVQRIVGSVGSVEIQNDFVRRLPVGFQEDLH